MVRWKDLAVQKHKHRRGIKMFNFFIVGAVHYGAVFAQKAKSMGRKSPCD